MSNIDMKKAIYIVLILLVIISFSSISHASIKTTCKNKPDICSDGSEGRVYAVLVSGEEGSDYIKDRYNDIINKIEDSLKSTGIINLEIKKFIYNDDPTGNNFKSYLDRLSSYSRPCDTLMFIYNGHGSKHHLLYQDLYNEGDEQRKLHYKELRQSAIAFKGKKFYVFDSCESGAFAQVFSQGQDQKNIIAMGATTGCNLAYTKPSNSFSLNFANNLKKNKCDIVAAYIQSKSPDADPFSYQSPSIFSKMNPKNAKLPCNCEECK